MLDTFEAEISSLLANSFPNPKTFYLSTLKAIVFSRFISISSNGEACTHFLKRSDDSLLVSQGAGWGNVFGCLY